jgi:hypothetical protein
MATGTGNLALDAARARSFQRGASSRTAGDSYRNETRAQQDDG